MKQANATERKGGARGGLESSSQEDRSVKTDGYAHAPSGWSAARIGDLTIRTEQRNPGRDPGKRFSYVDVSSVSNTSFRIAEPIELSGAQAPSRARKVIRVGDVLYATVRPTLKRVALVPRALDDQIASTAFIVLRAEKSRLDSSYLYYRLLTDEFIGQMRELERGASYPAVRESDVRNEKILVPAMAEQRKIARVLGMVQSAMEQQERLITLITELKKALLNKLFTQGLRGEPQKQTEIGLVPQSWDVVTLGSLARIGNGSTPKRDNEDYWRDGTIPWLNSTKIHERFITKADQFVTELAVKECHLPRVKPGSLLIAITGQGKTLGNSALISLRPASTSISPTPSSHHREWCQSLSFGSCERAMSTFDQSAKLAEARRVR